MSQLLSAWGANVTGTCSTNAIAKIVELGVHTAVDYTQQDVWKELKQVGKYVLFVIYIDEARRCSG